MMTIALMSEKRIIILILMNFRDSLDSVLHYQEEDYSVYVSTCIQIYRILFY